MAEQDTIDDVIARFEATFQPMIERNDEKRHFHGVYYRNMVAVKKDGAVALLDRGAMLRQDLGPVLVRWRV